MAKEKNKDIHCVSCGKVVAKYHEPADAYTKSKYGWNILHLRWGGASAMAFDLCDKDAHRLASSIGNCIGVMDMLNFPKVGESNEKD